jgi:hypothetical protein
MAGLVKDIQRERRNGFAKRLRYPWDFLDFPTSSGSGLLSPYPAFFPSASSTVPAPSR